MLIFLSMLTNGFAQEASVGSVSFDQELQKLLRFSVPLMHVATLHDQLKDVKVYDTRELSEYQVSHLPGAIHAGFKDFDKSVFEEMDKTEPIVLYCSVGYRSEKIGEQLLKMGFEKVYNLYGSIFEWVNQGYAVESAPDSLTTKIHTYNEKWSQWVTQPTAQKVW